MLGLLGASCGSWSGLWPGEVTSKRSLHFSVNQEKMEPLNGNVSRVSPKQEGPRSPRRCDPADPGPGPPAGPAAVAQTVGRVRGGVWAKRGVLDSHFSYATGVCGVVGRDENALEARATVSLEHEPR